jgi:hypothetical protein
MHPVLRSVVLALATFGASWAAYQAALWSGEQARDFAKDNALRSESVRASNRAFQEAQVDVTTFAVWSLAVGQNNDRAATFLRARFRREFRPAFEGWLATRGAGASPDGTPFERPDYRVSARLDSMRLLDEAQAAGASATRANDISDRFMLTVVLFGTVTFLAGTDSDGRGSRAARRFIAAVTIALLVFAGVFLLRLPQLFGS